MAIVHALYIVETRLTQSDPFLEIVRRDRRKAVREVAVVGTQFDLDVVTKIDEGTSYEEILKYVSAHGIDVVVLRTHGRTGIDCMVMGSVAERVVCRSSVPVPKVRSTRDD